MADATPKPLDILKNFWDTEVPENWKGKYVALAFLKEKGGNLVIWELENDSIYNDLQQSQIIQKLDF